VCVCVCVCGIRQPTLSPLTLCSYYVDVEFPQKDVVEIRETESQTRRIKQPLDRAIQMSIRARKFTKTIEFLNKEATVLISLKEEGMVHRVRVHCWPISLSALSIAPDIGHVCGRIVCSPSSPFRAKV
jgi:hypothetical protein